VATTFLGCLVLGALVYQILLAAGVVQYWVHVSPNPSSTQLYRQEHASQNLAWLGLWTLVMLGGLFAWQRRRPYLLEGLLGVACLAVVIWGFTQPHRLRYFATSSNPVPGDLAIEWTLDGTSMGEALLPAPVWEAFTKDCEITLPVGLPEMRDGLRLGAKTLVIDVCWIDRGGGSLAQTPGALDAFRKDYLQVSLRARVLQASIPRVSAPSAAWMRRNLRIMGRRAPPSLQPYLEELAQPPAPAPPPDPAGR
jgi:MYXO-CTERM domain-containing protein